MGLSFSGSRATRANQSNVLIPPSSSPREPGVSEQNGSLRAPSSTQISEGSGSAAGTEVEHTTPIDNIGASGAGDGAADAGVTAGSGNGFELRDPSLSAPSSSSSSPPRESEIDKRFSKKKDPIRAFFDPEQSLLRQESPRERDALKLLFKQTGGSGWDSKANWNTPRPLQYWYRVKWSHGKVIGLELNNNNLTGGFPMIHSLNSLTNLSISSNALSGAIDWSNVCSCVPSLKRLDISHNRFEGFIDWQTIVNVWTQAEILNLAENLFEGETDSRISS